MSIQAMWKGSCTGASCKTVELVSKVCPQNVGGIVVYLERRVRQLEFGAAAVRAEPTRLAVRNLRDLVESVRAVVQKAEEMCNKVYDDRLVDAIGPVENVILEAEDVLIKYSGVNGNPFESESVNSEASLERVATWIVNQQATRDFSEMGEKEFHPQPGPPRRDGVVIRPATQVEDTLLSHGDKGTFEENVWKGTTMSGDSPSVPEASVCFCPEDSAGVLAYVEGWIEDLRADREAVRQEPTPGSFSHLRARVKEAKGIAEEAELIAYVDLKIQKKMLQAVEGLKQEFQEFDLLMARKKLDTSPEDLKTRTLDRDLMDFEDDEVQKVDEDKLQACITTPAKDEASSTKVVVLPSSPKGGGMESAQLVPEKTRILSNYEDLRELFGGSSTVGKPINLLEIHVPVDPAVSKLFQSPSSTVIVPKGGETPRGQQHLSADCHLILPANKTRPAPEQQLRSQLKKETQVVPDQLPLQVYSGVDARHAPLPPKDKKLEERPAPRIRKSRIPLPVGREVSSGKVANGPVVPSEAERSRKGNAKSKSSSVAPSRVIRCALCRVQGHVLHNCWRFKRIQQRTEKAESVSKVSTEKNGSLEDQTRKMEQNAKKIHRVDPGKRFKKKKPLYCPLCEVKGHFLSHCPRFKEMQVDSRLSFCRQKRIHFLCLMKHPSGKCPVPAEKRKCQVDKECLHFHHQFLHGARFQSASDCFSKKSAATAVHLALEKPASSSGVSSLAESTLQSSSDASKQGRPVFHGTKFSEKPASVRRSQRNRAKLGRPASVGQRPAVLPVSKMPRTTASKAGHPSKLSESRPFPVRPGVATVSCCNRFSSEEPSRSAGSLSKAGNDQLSEKSAERKSSLSSARSDSKFPREQSVAIEGSSAKQPPEESAIQAWKVLTTFVARSVKKEFKQAVLEGSFGVYTEWSMAALAEGDPECEKKFPGLQQPVIDLAKRFFMEQLLAKATQQFRDELESCLRNWISSGDDLGRV